MDNMFEILVASIRRLVEIAPKDDNVRKWMKAHGGDGRREQEL